MAFSDYRRYTATELRTLFQVKIEKDQNLFANFTPSGNEYPVLQAIVIKIASRLKLSKFDNEATRGSLLAAPILWAAGEEYHLGVFFEPSINLQQETSISLPHPLSGSYDGALSLDEIDCVAPIISVVEVKRSSLSDGLGQCLAEMYATRQVFQQNKVYGIITDGEIWEFLLLEDSVLAVDMNNYYIKTVADIVDRIGYIASLFNK